MALIKCPECKKKISDQCGKCPNCGYPLDKICEADENQTTDIKNIDEETAKGKKSFDIKSLIKKWWFWVAVGVVIAAITTTTILLLNRDTKPKFDKEGNPVFVELTNEVYTNAQKYKGYHINIKGKVFQVMSDNGSVKGIQIWIDPDTCEQNMMIYYNTDVEVKQGDYIICSGYIDSVTEYKNAYDAKLYAPLVISSDLRKSTYMEVMAPANETITPENLKQEKYGYSVTIDKIEFAEKETRVYATVKNNGKALLNFGDAVIVQNGKQYNSTDNYEADYDEIPYEIVKGVSSSGIILFPAIATNDFELTIDIHSDDYDEEMDKFIFKISKEGIVTEKPSESSPTTPPTTSTTIQTQDPKNRNQEALKAANSYRDVNQGTTLTIYDLADYLTTLGFNDSEINYAVENATGFDKCEALEPSEYAKELYKLGYTREQIIQDFINGGMAKTDAETLVDTSGIDWNSEAVKAVKAYISSPPYNTKYIRPKEIHEQVLTPFSATQKDYAMKNCGFDFNAEALRIMRDAIAEVPQNITTYSPVGCKEFELYGFDESQQEYALNNCGINWNIAAVDYAKMLDLNLPNWDAKYYGRKVKRDEMIFELKNEGFTERQAIYGVDNSNIDWAGRE